MALIIKFSRLFPRCVGIRSSTNWHSSTINVLRWKNNFKPRKLCKMEFATAAPKIITAKNLESSIQQLDIDARYKQIIFKNNFEEILHAIKKWGCITYPQTILLLKCCNCLSALTMPEEKVELSKKVWELFTDLGVKLDIFHYNSLLNIYLQNEHVFSPENFLEILKQENIKPNLVTYQRLLKAYCYQGNIEGASNLLEIIKKEDFPINEDIFNSLILGHCQLNDLESAYGILDLMKEKKIKPSSETYLSLISGYAKVGNVNEIKKIINEAEEKESIILSDKDVFEIVYSLALNGHENCVDEFLAKTQKSFALNPQGPAIMSRLLHKKLDTVALKMFHLIPKEATNYKESTGKFLLKYYAQRRSIDDVLNLCSILENSGCDWAPLSFVSRFLVLEHIENPEFLFKFYRKMKEHNLPLRPHYFWPLLINAKKKGNNEILKVLSKMTQMNVPRCFWTKTKILFPSYSFGKNWADDCEKIKAKGIDVPASATYLLIKFLAEENWENAKELVLTKPVVPTDNLLVNSLLKSLINGKCDEKFFVEILYGLLHDFPQKLDESQLKKLSVKGSDNENDVKDVDNDNYKVQNDLINSDLFISNMISKLLKNLDRKTFNLQNVLKNMLEKKIPLPMEASSFILEKIKDEDVTSLVTQLTSSELNLKLDSNILASKKVNSSQVLRPLVNASILGDLPKGLAIWNALGDNVRFLDDVAMMILYLKHNDLDNVMKILEVLPSRSYDFNGKDYPEKFRVFFFSLMANENTTEENLKKAWKVGNRLNLIDKKLRHSFMKFHLKRNDLETALNIFCENSEEPKFIDVYAHLPLLGSLIKAKHVEGVEKVTSTVAKVRGKSASLTMLMFSFAEFGEIYQLKKLLETREFRLNKAFFDSGCQYFFKMSSIKCFENLFEATKNLFGFDRSTLYNYLLKLYIRKENVEKVKHLWLQWQLENIPGESNFYSEIAFFLKGSGEPVPSDLQEFLKEDNLGATKNQTKAVETIDRAIDLASKNDMEGAVALMQKESIFLSKLCQPLLKRNKMLVYLDLLKLTAGKENFRRGNWFPFELTVARLQENSGLMEEYKKAASECFKHGIVRPFHIYWLVCLSIPEKIKEAEEIYEHIQSKTPDLSLTLTGWLRKMKNPSVIEAVMASEKLKPCLGKKSANLYQALIHFYVDTKDSSTAVSYLNRAVEVGHGNQLSQNTIQELQELLEASGMSFPHPELLKKVCKSYWSVTSSW